MPDQTITRMWFGQQVAALLTEEQRAEIRRLHDLVEESANCCVDEIVEAAGGAEGDPSKDPGPADDGNALSPEQLPRSARGPAEPEEA